MVADFGCGEAKISSCIRNVVHSFDLVALNDRVTVCDMSHVRFTSLSLSLLANLSQNNLLNTS